ncbi:MAG: hypothetical protein VX589_19105 [Myxococcota bacterium]|nr:hypothetical protein [Myxococcota bacterium]
MLIFRHQQAYFVGLLSWFLLGVSLKACHPTNFHSMDRIEEADDADVPDAQPSAAGFAIGEDSETFAASGADPSTMLSGRQSRDNAANMSAWRHVPDITAEQLEDISVLVAGLWRGDDMDARVSFPQWPGDAGPVYLAVRRNGVRLWHGWGVATDGFESLRAVVADARTAVEQTHESPDADVLELVFTFDQQTIDLRDPMDRRRLTSNIFRGLKGFTIEYNGRVKHHAPTLQIAQNRSLEKSLTIALDDFFGPSLAEQGTTAYRAEQFARYERLQTHGRVQIFDAIQILIDVRELTPSIQVMFRGNRIVAMSDVTAARTRQLANGMVDWLSHHLHADGRMTYVYYPSRGEEGPAQVNNMIRQWMATVALGKIAADRRDPSRWAQAALNIDYNLGAFYHEEGELGLIEWNHKVKLGALGLACLAILQHPQRAKWAQQEAAMRRTIDSLWRADGSFATFYKKPEGTPEQVNFYPGEALLYLTARYAESPNRALLNRLKTSFDYYRAWHLDPDHRNPAFVPWHTQAWYQLWHALDDGSFRREIATFIFTMTDWLLSMQQWDSALTADTRGRFYDPSRPQYGVPHASATGVYIEGLIDAYQLAVFKADEVRSERYRTALIRGLRSLMQLQFFDDLDAYYISQRAQVLGGIRTTVYDNRIRVDNVQHGLMGVLKILRIFAPTDYAESPLAAP